MNRTLKDAMVKRYHDETQEQLKTHLQLFLDACNHAKRLRTLKGLTPYEFICKSWGLCSDLGDGRLGGDVG